jgi:hypothetical protein
LDAKSTILSSACQLASVNRLQPMLLFLVMVFPENLRERARRGAKQIFQMKYLRPAADSASSLLRSHQNLDIEELASAREA